MIIVDTALARRAEAGDPVRLAMVGTGAMGRAIARQILMRVPGIRLVAIYNRTIERAESAYLDAGAGEVTRVSTPEQLDAAIAGGRYAVCEDVHALCAAQGVDAVLEVTGTIDFGAEVVMSAFEHRKTVVTMNAELAGTLGPILKVHADRAGVVFTDSDGDQPGVIMNVMRFVESIGCKPVLAGNIKGLQDPYRNPTTQEGYASTHGLSPELATSAADGTKVSFEMAIVANATGFRTGVRGMYGPACKDVQEARHLFPMDQMLDGGLVDYILGAEPSPGVFVLATEDDQVQRDLLKLYKLGDGPLYTFYRPYHLCHFEVPLTVARATLFDDVAVAPIGPPVVEVISIAKRDLRAGERVDGIGGYTVYGQCENADAARGLLPMGLAEGAALTRDVPKDEAIALDDVELRSDRLCDRLRAEQAEMFALA